MNETKAQPAPETQKQRWVKYGANVALTIVVVIALAIAVTYLADRFSRRIDTTAAGIYSLKQQTVNLIRDNTQKIKLVSLYTEKDARRQDNPFFGPVRDLLEEYASKSPNIEYEAIDPITQPTKTDALLAEAVEKYGAAVKEYESFLAEFNKTWERLRDLASTEAASVASIQTDQLGADEQGQTLSTIIATIRDEIPQTIARMKERTDRSLKVKFPDYRAIADRIRETINNLSQAEGSLSRYANQYKADERVPEAIRAYFAEAPERLSAIKAVADEVLSKIDALPELKIGELMQAIKGQDLILVLGENDWRVLTPEQVWVNDTRDLRAFADNATDLKPRFAGEQAVTTAILSLKSGDKPKVAFVRAGGRPLADPGFPPFQRGGPLSDVADRLRAYNFEVLERDVTGMWAMQSQMQGMPAAPEATEEQIRDAVWIVINMPGDQRMGPPPSIAPKLKEHLDNGGSAMVLAMPQADDLSEAIRDFGIELLTDAVVVHEVPRGERARSSDVAEEIQRLPYVFVADSYADHLLARPLQSLDTLIAAAVPVRINPIADVKQSPLVTLPSAGQTWGETNLDTIGADEMKFEPEAVTPDIAPPFQVSAAAEKGESRLVVFGGMQSFTNEVLSWPDAEMLKRRIVVSRFPGNGELFTNSVFWLAKMEPMIAISPAAMEVSRIRPMSDAALAGWRVGVLLILLPGLVLAAGIAMYFARRD